MNVRLGQDKHLSIRIFNFRAFNIYAGTSYVYSWWHNVYCEERWARLTESTRTKRNIRKIVILLSITSQADLFLTEFCCKRNIRNRIILLCEFSVGLDFRFRQMSAKFNFDSLKWGRFDAEQFKSHRNECLIHSQTESFDVLLAFSNALLYICFYSLGRVLEIKSSRKRKSSIFFDGTNNKLLSTLEFWFIPIPVAFDSTPRRTTSLEFFSSGSIRMCRWWALARAETTKNCSLLFFSLNHFLMLEDMLKRWNAIL